MDGLPLGMHSSDGHEPTQYDDDQANGGDYEVRLHGLFGFVSGFGHPGLALLPTLVVAAVALPAALGAPWNEISDAISPWLVLSDLLPDEVPYDTCQGTQIASDRQWWGSIRSRRRGRPLSMACSERAETIGGQNGMAIYIGLGRTAYGLMSPLDYYDFRNTM